ncbi:MAG: hypothetical protein RLP44_32875 [Aggregatilineales bacterium]
MRVKMFLVMMMSCLFGLGLNAQTADSLTFVSSTFAGDFGDPTHMTLSPDGTYLAWTEARDGLCLHHFDDDSTTCTPFPTIADPDEDIDLRDHTALHWSPDSLMIAFTENWTQNFTESDLWLFDVASQTFANRTNDGVSGSAIMLDQREQPYFLDALPTWNPATGDLVFFRYERTGRTYSTALYRIPRLGASFAGVLQGDDGLAQGEPEFVAQFADLSALSVYDGSTFNLAGGATISPDGTQLAFLSRPAQADRAGIWLVDLQTGDITTPLDFESLQGIGLPEWHNAQIMFNGIAWINDNSLLISASPISALENTINLMLYRYDITDEALTPMFDLSDVPQTFTNDDDDSPRSVAFSDTSDTIFFFNFNRNTGRSELSALTIDDQTAITLHEIPIDTFQFTQMTQPTIGMSERVLRVLIYGHLFEFAVDS